QRDLVATQFQVPIKTVLGDVELSADEPLHIGLFEVPLEHLVPFPPPGEMLCLARPEAFGIRSGMIARCVVLVFRSDPVMVFLHGGDQDSTTKFSGRKMVFVEEI